MTIFLNSVNIKSATFSGGTPAPEVEWYFSSSYMLGFQGYKDVNSLGVDPMTVTRNTTGTSESIDWTVTANASFISPISGTLNFGPLDDTLEIPFVSFTDPGSGNSVDVEVTLSNPSTGNVVSTNPGIFRIENIGI